MTIWLATERRSALITGGSRGIGRGIATHLSQQGWTRTLVGRARVQLAQVHSELDIAAAAVHIVAADQTVDAAIELHRRTFGSMNALILAAGVARPDPSRTIPKPRPDKQIALNFRSPFLLAGQQERRPEVERDLFVRARFRNGSRRVRPSDPGGQDQCVHRSERAAVQFDGGVDGLVGCDDVHGGGGDVEFGMDLREPDTSTSDQDTCCLLYT